MIRFLLRAVGFVLLAAAFASLVVDGTRSIAAQGVLQFSLVDTAGWLFGRSLAALLQASGRWPVAVQRVMLGFLAVPTWIATGTVGLLLLYAGRRPTAGIGFSGRRT